MLVHNSNATTQTSKSMVLTMFTMFSKGLTSLTLQYPEFSLKKRKPKMNLFQKSSMQIVRCILSQQHHYHQVEDTREHTASILMKISFFSRHSSEFSPSSCRTRDSSRSVCSMAFFSSSLSLIPASTPGCSGLT